MIELRFFVLFPSHTVGMKLDSVLRKEGIKHTIVPTPRQLSVSCGISIMYNEEDGDRIKKLIEENKVNILSMESLEFEKKNFYL